jgi:hypothetical protein
MTRPSEILNPANQVRVRVVEKEKSESGTVCKAWSFQLMVKADLCHGTAAVEKEKLLREQISACTGNNRPLSVIGVVVFCDRSLFSQPPDSDGGAGPGAA